MHKNSDHLFIIFLLILFFIFPFKTISQDADKIKTSSLELTNLYQWCSDASAFSTKDAEYEEKRLPSCVKSSAIYNKWFRFSATTSSIECIVKTGGAQGTMQFTYIALWDENFKELACKPYSDATGDLALTYNDLEFGNFYYLSVSHPYNPKYVGTFTLCVKDEVGYDFREGAFELLDLDNWCSENACYTTKGASPDEEKTSCLQNGPNYNRWFKFYARSNKIEIKVLTGQTKGNMRFPYITLWNARMKELKCGKYNPENPETTAFDYDELVRNNWYYISIDHVYNADYQGSFSICINGVKKAEQKEDLKNEITILGRLLYNFENPYQTMITLLDAGGNELKTTMSDKTGKFSFAKLEKDKEYKIRVDNYESGKKIALIQTNFEGEIISRGVPDNGKVFRFVKLQQDCNYLGLINCDDTGLLTDEGKTGIVGIVSNKNSRVDFIKNLSVYLYSNPESVIDSTKTDRNGSFRFVNLPEKDQHLIRIGESDVPLFVEIAKVNDKGKVIMTSGSDDIDSKGFFHFKKLAYIEARLEFEDGIDLTIIEPGDAIVLENIYFETAKYNLLETSYTELNKLVNVLKKDEKLKIHISGHTDNTGNPDFNARLSEKRAQAVVNYLISNGISTARLSYKGYGSLRPVESNGSEEAKKKNRRVEFSVISK